MFIAAKETYRYYYLFVNYGLQSSGEGERTNIIITSAMACTTL